MKTLFGKRNMARLRKSELMALNVETSLSMCQDESLSERNRIAHLYSAIEWMEMMQTMLDKVFDDLKTNERKEQAQ